jgi:uncharacterized protein YbjT (DUF2867 family)
MMDKKTVLVVGATGMLGLKITKALLDQGDHVRVLVRSTSDRTKLKALGVTDFVSGDLMDPDSLRKAFEVRPKADALIASAAGYTGHTKGDLPTTDTIGYANLVEASKTAGLPRFVLVSILECDKAASVPHFHHKYQVEKSLQDRKQPFISLRAGAFLDQSEDGIPSALLKNTYPEFVPGALLGMIYTPDLARYAALAAHLPDSALNQCVDVGWSVPANGTVLAQAFTKVLGRAVVPVPAFAPFLVNVMMPFLGLFQPALKDMLAMVNFIKSGVYVSADTEKQRQWFGELPTPEEAVRRYCTDNKVS